MSAATVRRARPSDLGAAVALWRQLQAEHEALDARHRPSDSAAERWSNDFHVWAKSDAHRVFVAEAGGRLVGLVTAHPYWPSPMYEQELEVYVTELVVSPEARGEGVGARLVGAVRAWAREQGVAQIRAGVLSRNERGRVFWRREGAEDLYATVTLPTDDAPGTTRV
jgi:GNAT superfamily N-acetyltransferase